MKLKIVKNNTQEAKNIEVKLKSNNNYCPCAVMKNEDTKCMCKDFRNQTTVGDCHCGLYRKEQI